VSAVACGFGVALDIIDNDALLGGNLREVFEYHVHLAHCRLDLANALLSLCNQAVVELPLVLQQ